MANDRETVLVATSSSEELATKVAQQMGLPLTPLIKKTFADGETYHAFPKAVAGKDLVIIGATHADSSYLELLDLIQGGRYWNAATINVVIPFLGYSTMERVKPFSHEIPKGITRTRLIFQTTPDFVAFVDLHSEAVLHSHDGSIHTYHIWTDKLVMEKIRASGLADFVLVSPDYGFSKRVARLARLLDCPQTAADKDRFDTDKTIVGQISSVVRGKTAIICDDMIRTGGSIAQTAERCLEAGAKDVMVLATHLVLAPGAREKLAASPIKKIIGSDSYPGRRSDDFLDIYSLAPLLAEVIGRNLSY